MSRYYSQSYFDSSLGPIIKALKNYSLILFFIINLIDEWMQYL